MSKVLLVEDDQFLVRVYSVKLKQQQIESVILTDGTNAQSTAEQERPNVIVLDLIMPHKDGFEVLKELKTNSVTKNIPVIVLSALNHEADTFKKIGVEPEAYFTKSEVNFDKVIDKIRTYLDK